MNCSPAANAFEFFTASALGAALGVSRTRAHQYMAGVKQQVQTVRGRPAHCWPIKLLPARILEQLQPIAQRLGCSGVAHLLATPPAPWQPPHPLASLSPGAVIKAQSRQRVLAPILAAPDAQTARVSDLVRRAMLEFQSPGVDLPAAGERAVRRWIETVIERDKGLWQWSRVELYLDPDAPLKTPAAEQKSALCEAGGDAVGIALLAIEKPGSPSDGERSAVWEATFKRLGELVESGVKEGSAKRALMGILRKNGILPGSSSAARSMAWARQFKKWNDGGRSAEALVDGRAFNAKREVFNLTDKEKAALRKCVLEKGSLDMALRWFVKRAACRPETRILIEERLDAAAQRRRLPNWPMSLRRAAHVTVEEQAKFRGPKKFQDLEQVSHRGMWYHGPEGEKLPVHPNMIWESDDMSSNEPFCYLDPESDKVFVGRQTLCTQDVLSLSWLAVMPLGRARDSYRVEDLADHIMEAVLANGMPGIWRIERGVWDNNFINGIPLPDDTRWGGLGALFHVERTYKSRGKGSIESSFDHLQSFLAHESLSIGRKRGEFEKGTKEMLRAKAGNEAAAAKFWSMGEYADAVVGAMKEFNASPKRRRAFGRDVVAPNDLYRGAVRRECPESELWRFCPVKKLATVRRGHVEVSVPYYPRPFSFRVNGEDDRYFEHGYPVLIAFHPGHPERGCHVFNAERGARNRDGVPFAEFLLLAPFVDDAPQIGSSPTDREMMARKRANAAVTQEFRSIVGNAPRISVARDSYGKSVRRERGAPAPSVVGVDRSIKAQRSERRKRQADEYSRRAASQAVDQETLEADVHRSEDRLVANGRAHWCEDGSLHIY